MVINYGPSFFGKVLEVFDYTCSFPQMQLKSRHRMFVFPLSITCYLTNSSLLLKREKGIYTRSSVTTNVTFNLNDAPLLLYVTSLLRFVFR